MGFNLHLVVLEHSSVDRLAVAGWLPTGATVSAEEASHSWYDGIAAYESAGHVVLLDPTLRLAGRTGDLATSLGTTVVSATFGSTAEVHAYQVDGPDVSRLVVLQEGEVVEDQGGALPEEAGVRRDDGGENWLFDLLAARGHRLDLDVPGAVVLTHG
ncbi:hypothetical protein INN71_16785 [Nocardioides sp. ChNu-153]|uniref:hypothetical protein n=1 Tax=unclassified Nocardioides TaxID=2615069 RepID=UPI0024059C90|nr:MULTISPECIES: hypothetical protein [unclassified Nocardioides]MDF9716669.1 hypothetical protein [Nocardioides sp. ChNu-99]MDN7123042.1 hypothetical protein [Nocardioides sp. ChNu-153]